MTKTTQWYEVRLNGKPMKVLPKKQAQEFGKEIKSQGKVTYAMAKPPAEELPKTVKKAATKKEVGKPAKTPPKKVPLPEEPEVVPKEAPKPVEEKPVIPLTSAKSALRDRYYRYINYALAQAGLNEKDFVKEVIVDEAKDSKGYEAKLYVQPWGSSTDTQTFYIRTVDKGSPSMFFYATDPSKERNPLGVDEIICAMGIDLRKRFGKAKTKAAPKDYTFQVNKDLVDIPRYLPDLLKTMEDYDPIVPVFRDSFVLINANNIMMTAYQMPEGQSVLGFKCDPSRYDLCINLKDFVEAIPKSWCTCRYTPEGIEVYGKVIPFCEPTRKVAVPEIRYTNRYLLDSGALSTAVKQAKKVTKGWKSKSYENYIVFKRTGTDLMFYAADDYAKGRVPDYSVDKDIGDAEDDGSDYRTLYPVTYIESLAKAVQAADGEVTLSFDEDIPLMAEMSVREVSLKILIAPRFEEE